MIIIKTINILINSYLFIILNISERNLFAMGSSSMDSSIVLMSSFDRFSDIANFEINHCAYFGGENCRVPSQVNNHYGLFTRILLYLQLGSLHHRQVKRLSRNLRMSTLIGFLCPSTRPEVSLLMMKGEAPCISFAFWTM